MIDNQIEEVNSKEIPPSDKAKIDEKVIFSDDERKLKFYEHLRKQIKIYITNKTGHHGGKLAEYLFLLPDLFILVCRLAVDSRVPTNKKVFVGAIITYLILPIDIIPDFIPVIGYLDDLVLVVLALNQIFNELDKQILIDNWSGQGDILELLQKITALTEKFIDKTILQKIREWIRKRI